MTKVYTPGPWSYNLKAGVIKRSGHVIGADNYIICELPDAGDGAAPYTKANARLIASAPDLLEAALLVIERWNDGDLNEAVRMLAIAACRAIGGDIQEEI